MSSAAAGYLEERSQRAKHPRIGPFGDVLGELAGKRVVEYGCGDGELTVRLAESGALMSAFDGSRACVERTRRLAEANGVRVEAVGASAERLPYADETFDLAVGQAVLQRLDPERARYELWRILKPGGKAFFSEPLRHVDLALWGRDFSESGCRRVGLLRRRALVWMVR
jgi:2-polyprenyl-3-methyl-5-hydroxy-6-metoxy-1,4-benzoquinol methylase